MRDKRVSEMTSIAMFVAIIVVMGLIPYVGFIPIFGTTVTTLHIPVIIGAIYGGKKFGGPKFGLVLGTMFGLVSFARAFIPFFPLDALFQNPIVAIIPRAIFGVVSWYLYVGLTKLISNDKISTPLTFLLATLAHTVVVLGTVILVLGFYVEFFGVLAEYLVVIIPVNGSFEIAIAVLLGAPIMIRLSSYIEMNTVENDTL